MSVCPRGDSSRSFIFDPDAHRKKMRSRRRTVLALVAAGASAWLVACGETTRSDETGGATGSTPSEEDASSTAAGGDATVSDVAPSTVDATPNATPDTGADATADVVPTPHLVGGSVNGLAGSGLVLTLGAETRSIGASGPFTFATKLAPGAPYAVTVKTQPVNPEQRCTVNKGTGTIGATDVSDIAVDCATLFKVGGTVTGLLGGTVILQNDGVDDLSLDTSGPFEFATKIADGDNYAVTVKTQPTGETCAVKGGAGKVSGATVSTITVSCGGVAEFATPGNYTFTVPAGVTSISAVVIGAGGVGGQMKTGGGGGALAYKNDIAVTPGQKLAVVVGMGGVWTQKAGDVYAGSASSFAGMTAGGGSGGDTTGAGGTATGGDANFSGGSGATTACGYPNAGGGGAAGYTENGHDGVSGVCAPGYEGGQGGNAGDVGASGGQGNAPCCTSPGTVACCTHHGGSGGGTGLFGVNSGVTGANGTTDAAMGIGGAFGGGAGSGGNGFGGTPSTGGSGAVKVIWPGTTRSFPQNAY